MKYLEGYTTNVINITHLVIEYQVLFFLKSHFLTFYHLHVCFCSNILLFLNLKNHSCFLEKGIAPY